MNGMQETPVSPLILRKKRKEEMRQATSALHEATIA